MLGYGWAPYFVEGDDPAVMHPLMAATLDRAVADIRRTRAAPRAGIRTPTWPMIVLRTPKGWTGPKVVDGEKVEGTFRSHQVPLRASARTRSTSSSWKNGSKYRPRNCSIHGGLRRICKRSLPMGQRRMGANPHANGGLLLKDCICRTSDKYAVEVLTPGSRPRTHESSDVFSAMSYNEHAELPNLGTRRDPFEPLGAVFEASNGSGTRD